MCYSFNIIKDAGGECQEEKKIFSPDLKDIKPGRERKGEQRMAEVAMEARIQGRVQGVGFRHFVMEKAQRLDLVGYVQNLPDGDVGVYAEGEKEDLKKFENHLNEGPFMARVTNVQVEWGEAEGEFSSFEVKF